MRRTILILFVCCLFTGQAWCGERPPHTIMLVLGSDNPEILTHRTEVAYRLYRLQPFDKIVVSGGCAAHASSICEATMMHDQLVAKGVPSSVIYKEENSKTTVQNYIFSRALKDAQGELVIQPKDSLYIVSDHWHAIAVAARFEQYDGVVAQFFIEGNIKPKATDMLDYGKIFTGEEDNDTFVLRGLWPTPDAVMDVAGKKHYFFGKHVYVQESDTTYQWKPLTVLFPNLPQDWRDGVDEIVTDHTHKRWIIIKDSSYGIIPFSNVRQQVAPMPLSHLVKGLPISPSNKVADAAYIVGNELYVFSNQGICIAKRKKGKPFEVVDSVAIDKLFPMYPFGWGKVNPSAAYYDSRTKTLLLYKNREVLNIVDKQIVEGYPKRLKLKWPVNNK